MRVSIRPDGEIVVTYESVVPTPAPQPAPVVVERGVEAAVEAVASPTPTTPPKAARKSEPKSAKPRKSRKDPTKSAENKAVFAQIRQLVAEGEWAEAIAVAEGRGWVAEADRLRKRAEAAQGSTPPKAARKPRKRLGGESKDGDGQPVFDEGGEAEAAEVSTEGETLESILKSLRGQAMSAVRWGTERNEPERIERVLRDVKRRLSGARKGRKLAFERSDAAGVEAFQAQIRGFADVADRLQEALDALAVEA
jgi:hypothetical protein